MFTAPLYTIAKMWKLTQCPSTDEWINKVYPYNGILFSHEKESSTDTCYNMDASENILSEKKTAIKGHYSMITLT